MTESVNDVAHSEAHSESEQLTPQIDLKNYLTLNRVVADLNVTSRKRLFEQFSILISANCEHSRVDDNIDNAEGTLLPSSDQIFNTLHGRERLGCTALGKGIALPHGRIEGLSEPVIAIAKLREPIDYDSTDGALVWFAVCLLVPSEANEMHLNLLAVLASKFSDDQFVCDVKESDTPEALYRLFAAP